ncbi:hypothetical protein EV127DRAFT_24278 [Xylaria flabelliformis]|nr:hypothetical protein EV127DRAFT_24278 [Xylaria flabelliformis]
MSVYYYFEFGDYRRTGAEAQCGFCTAMLVSSSSAVTYERGSKRLGSDFLQITSLVYFHYQDPDGGLRKLDVEERWVQNVVSIHEISQQEELPALSGKGIPGEWRSNRDWKKCLQNPWTTYQRQGLNTDACTVAALFPGSLIFNTTVAPLKISPPSANDDSKGKSDNANMFLVSDNNE